MKSIVLYIVTWLLITAGFFITSITAYDQYTHDATTLSDVWNRDIQQLKSDKQLPTQLFDLKEITYVINDPIAQVWSQFANPPFQKKNGGQYQLEILIISQAESDGTYALIQHHLTHVASGNSVWEMARRYRVHD